MRIIGTKIKLGYIFIECDKRGFKVDNVGTKYILNLGKRNELVFSSLKEVKCYIASL